MPTPILAVSRDVFSVDSDHLQLEWEAFQLTSWRLGVVPRKTSRMLNGPSRMISPCPPSVIMCMKERQELTQPSIDNISLLPKKKLSETRFYELSHKGYFITPKFLRYLAQSIVRQRASTFQIPGIDDGIQPPNKNWPTSFYQRQDLKPRTLKPLEWERHDIYKKVEHWFTVIGRELREPTILAENVFNMDETGIAFRRLASRKVLLHKNELRKHREAGSKRTQVMSIEWIAADGRCLHPLIIWPTSTIRSDRTTHSTPGWDFTSSPSGYNNRHIALEWFRRVFDPQTKSRANGRPRILINDGFTAHESLDVLKFCHENNITLCRLLLTRPVSFNCVTWPYSDH